jgi:hypothetical protein
MRILYLNYTILNYYQYCGNVFTKAWKYAFQALETCFPVLWKYAYQYCGNMLTSTVEICLPVLWKHAFQYFGNMLTSTLVIYWSILPHIELSDIKDKSLIWYNPFVKSLECNT